MLLPLSARATWLEVAHGSLVTRIPRWAPDPLGGLLVMAKAEGQFQTPGFLPGPSLARRPEGLAAGMCVSAAP